MGVRFVGQQMISPVEGDETFRMTGSRVKLSRFVNRYRPVLGGVENEQGTVKGFDLILDFMLVQIVQKLPCDPEGPPSDIYLRRALGFDPVEFPGEVRAHVIRRKGRPDRRYRFYGGKGVRRAEDGRPAEAVAHQ